MTNEWIDENRRWWDERAPISATSEFYDLDAFRREPHRLRPFELDELGVDPTGRDLVHLQCHIGTDTLSWAAEGANVVGLDFSAPAIDAARRLATDCGLEDRAEFIVADVYDAVAALEGRTFDVVYTGVGALSWLPDIEAWSRVVVDLLRPGGALYLVEIHPFLWPFADTPEVALQFDYFAALESDDATGSYADPSATTEHDHVFERNWGIGRVVNAAIASGLALEHLAEHGVGVQQVWPEMVQVPGRPDLWRMPDDRPALPLLWSLRARKQAAES